MLFNCHSSMFVGPMPYDLPRVCLHQEAFPLSNSLQPARPAVASRSCSSRGPVWICVIVTGSITTFKYENIICNNKNKLAWCHLHTKCIYSSVSDTNHTRKESVPRAYVSTASHYSLSLKHKPAQISGLAVSKIYIEVHIRLRVTTVYRKVIYGAFWGEEGRVIWSEWVSERSWEEVKLPWPLNNHQKIH